MLKCPVYLYPNSFTIILDLDLNTRIYNNMYQREIQLQKGLKNTIQFQFKNSDQKFVNISTGTFVFNMFDAINQRQLVSRVLDVVDDGVTTSTRGLATLTIYDGDTVDLDNGKYQFSVSAYDSDGSYEPTYANTYYAMAGTLELRSDGYPTLQQSYEVFDFQPEFDYTQSLYLYYSGNIPSHPEFAGNTALHTVSYHMTGYRGQVWVEGTQDNSPNYFSGFVEIAGTRKTYGQGLVGFTGNDYQNFYGVWSYIRIIYQPTPNPINMSNDYLSISYRGTFDKAIYRY